MEKHHPRCRWLIITIEIHRILYMNFRSFQFEHEITWMVKHFTSFVRRGDHTAAASHLFAGAKHVQVQVAKEQVQVIGWRLGRGRIARLCHFGFKRKRLLQNRFQLFLNRKPSWNDSTNHGNHWMMTCIGPDEEISVVQTAPKKSIEPTWTKVQNCWPKSCTTDIWNLKLCQNGIKVPPN